MFERAQEFSVTFQEQRAIRTSKLNHNLRALPKLCVDRRICANAVLQAKSSLLNGVAQDFINTSGGGNSILDRHGLGDSHLRELERTFLTSFRPIALPDYEPEVHRLRERHGAIRNKNEFHPNGTGEIRAPP